MGTAKEVCRTEGCFDCSTLPAVDNVSSPCEYTKYAGKTRRRNESFNIPVSKMGYEKVPAFRHLLKIPDLAAFLIQKMQKSSNREVHDNGDKGQVLGEEQRGGEK